MKQTWSHAPGCEGIAQRRNSSCSSNSDEIVSAVCQILLVQPSLI